MSMRDHVLVLACVLLFVALAAPLRSCLVDDTYIHMQYARNLAESGELSFNRGDPTYGATSPLWVFVLSVAYRLGGDLQFWCRALSWAFAAATIALLYRVVMCITGRRETALAAAAIMAAEAWFVRWTAVGMETPFAVCMVLAVLVFSFRAMRSHVRSALFGIALFLAVLSRPEAMLLVPLSLLVFLLARRRPLTVRLVWFGVFVVSFGVWLLVIKRHTGTYFPLTAGAKQGMPVFSAAIITRALIPAKIMGLTLALPWMAIVICLIAGLAGGKSPLFFFSVGMGKGEAGAAAGAGRAEIGARAKRPGAADAAAGAADRGTGLLLALFWAFALPVVYVLFDFQVLSRYLVPVFPAVIMLGVIGAAGLMRKLIPRRGVRRLALIIFTVIAVAQNVIFYRLVVVG